MVLMHCSCLDADNPVKTEHTAELFLDQCTAPEAAHSKLRRLSMKIRDPQRNFETFLEPDNEHYSCPAALNLFWQEPHI